MQQALFPLAVINTLLVLGLILGAILDATGTLIIDKDGKKKTSLPSGDVAAGEAEHEMNVMPAPADKGQVELEDV